MDPDEVLKQITDMVKDHADTPLLPIEVDELIEKIEALDEWLTKGGFLPAAWMVSR